MLDRVRQALTLLEAGERKQYFWLLVLSAFAAVVQSLAILSILPFIVLLANPDALLTNQFLAQAYEIVGVDSRLGFLAILGTFGVATLTFGNSILAVEQWITHRFLCMLGHRLEKDTFRHMLQRPYADHIGQHSGMLSDVILNQTERFVDGVIGASIAIVGNLALAAFVVALLLFINPVTTLVTLLALISMYLGVFLLFRRSFGAHGEALTMLSGKLFVSVKETFDGLREIKTRNVEAFFADRFERSSLPLSRLAIKVGVLNFLPNFILETLVLGGLVGVALYFILVTESAGATLSYIALYAIAAYRLIPSMKSIAEGLATIQHDGDAVRIVSEYSDQPRLKVAASSMPKPERDIVVEDVTFEYNDADVAQLREVNFSIPVGASVCLFGPSGAGKSTLMHILAGLIFPQQGHVLGDGVAVTPASVGAWRRHLGYCPQQVYLYDDSMASNIAFGLESNVIDYARVAVVGKLALLNDFAGRSKGTAYSEIIGEQGQSLSGGQRQRLGIARLLYPDPDIMLMDEVFIGLDAPTSAAIQDNLFNLSGKTLIFASHDGALARRCDLVLVLDAGHLIASGPFDQARRDSVRFQEMLSSMSTGNGG